MVHADPHGKRAAEVWEEQLLTVGSVIDAVDFGGLAMTTGDPVKDLNDATQLAENQPHDLSDLIPHENLLAP